MSPPHPVALVFLAFSFLQAQDSSWLPPGLIYSLTPIERQLAEQAAPAERAALLSSFWRTRNAAELQRRVEFANQHFSTSTKSGWQTDRGRIYIQHGPPDEISRPHQVPATATLPTEQWRYRQKEASEDFFAFAFADPGRRGDYSLVLQSAQRPALSPHYTAWIAEDVLYIAEAHERLAFLRLQTDEEREAFIEQFWQRRDPDPTTPANEFQLEHYRRIAFANRHFAHGAGPGWRSDRGRIYIQYGPPDEIQSQPAPPAAPDFPYERWIYGRAGRKSFTFRGTLLETTLTLAEKPH